MPEDQTEPSKPEKKPMSLLLPKASKLSGSREWLTNLFSPNKTKSSADVDNEKVDQEEIPDEQIAIEINGVTVDSESMDTADQESQIKRKSPSEPISNMCSSMRRQIISRAFYGWLSHCRHMKIIRKHLGDLTFKEAPMVIANPQWHQGVTQDWLASIDWHSIRQSQDALQAFEREIDLKIYLGGIEACIRKEVRKGECDHHILEKAIMFFRSGLTSWVTTSGLLHRRKKAKLTKRSKWLMRISCRIGWPSRLL